MPARKKPEDINDYISGFAPEVQAILQEIRSTIQKAVPDAAEKISYQIPAFTFGGKVFIFFAAFKKHIGLYPPMKGDAKLEKETARYAGEKGNLQLPLSESRDCRNALPGSLTAKDSSNVTRRAS